MEEGPLGDQREQDVHHPGKCRRRVRGPRRHGQRQGEGRSNRLRLPCRHEGALGREKAPQARDALLGYRRTGPGRYRGRARRRGGAGQLRIPGHDEKSRRRADLHRRPLRGDRPGGDARGAGLFEGAGAVRTRGVRVPGDPVDVRGHGDRARGRGVDDLPGGVAQGRRTPLYPGSGDGQAVRLRGGDAGDDQGGRGVRRVWIHGGVPRRAVHARREAVRDRGRDLGGAADHHRPRPHPQSLNAVTAAGKEILGGNTRAAARLMRDLDDEIPSAIRTLKELYRHTGRAYILGVTGAPGAGKSTLVNRITTHLRRRGKSVGIVAIDPTSPYSGGAILGDRIRMQEHALDDGVFIKSLATRGHLGGLSRSTFDVAHVLDAMGYERVLIETVGVGQDEVDVMRAAHTTVVVTVPGLGDDIQAIKSGLLEVADVLVVNKADREGADRTERDLMHMLDLRASDRKDVAIVRTIATKGNAEGSGIAELAAAVEAHRERVWTGASAIERGAVRAAAEQSELV